MVAPKLPIRVSMLSRRASVFLILLLTQPQMSQLSLQMMGYPRPFVYYCTRLKIQHILIISIREILMISQPRMISIKERVTSIAIIASKAFVIDVLGIFHNRLFFSGRDCYLRICFSFFVRGSDLSCQSRHLRKK